MQMVTVGPWDVYGGEEHSLGREDLEVDARDMGVDDRDGVSVPETCKQQYERGQSKLDRHEPSVQTVVSRVHAVTCGSRQHHTSSCRQRQTAKRQSSGQTLPMQARSCLASFPHIRWLPHGTSLHCAAVHCMLDTAPAPLHCSCLPLPRPLS